MLDDEHLDTNTTLSKEERKKMGIELAEEKISKQALLEALFNTQYWGESYV